MEKYKQYEQTILEKIKSDEVLNAFLKELTSDQISEYLPLLYEQYLSNSLCKNCLGKKECEKDETNYQSYLTLEDGKVLKHLTPCEYLPTYNFELVDLLYLPTEMFKGEIDYHNENRKEFFNKAIEISQNKDRKGTYLYGKYGTGKTFLTYNFVTKLAKKGKSVIFCLTPELVREIKNNITVPTFMDKIIVKLKKADVLVLDDLGGEMNTAFSRDEILFPILDSRMNDLTKLTFATSNLSLKELEEHFANEKNLIDPVSAGRIMERIRSMMDPIELEGMNYRH